MPACTEITVANGIASMNTPQQTQPAPSTNGCAPIPPYTPFYSACRCNGQNAAMQPVGLQTDKGRLKTVYRFSDGPAVSIPPNQRLSF